MRIEIKRFVFDLMMNDASKYIPSFIHLLDIQALIKSIIIW